MFNFLYKKYYPFKDYYENCKHKMFGQQSLSCRKRKDKTLIGGTDCRYFCKHNAGFGINNRGHWIRCKCLKEATVNEQ
jgi:hypothetical protein